VVVITVLAIIHALLGIGAIIAGTIVRDFGRFHLFSPLVAIQQAVQPTNDLLISVVLVMHLRRNRTGFKATDDVITNISRLTIQTGGITAIWALAAMILFVLVPSNINFVFNFPIATLYGCCLMASLNARADWCDKLNKLDHLTIPTDTCVGASPSADGGGDFC